MNLARLKPTGRRSSGRLVAAEFLARDREVMRALQVHP
jgi:hypothetical protein